MTELDVVRKNGLRPTVVCCALNDNKVLFLFKREYNIWLMPQGGVLLAETLEEALFRELTEELGSLFVQNCAQEVSFVGEDSAEFFPKDVPQEDIDAKIGKGAEMKGKHYYFLAVSQTETSIDLGATQFDDYFWLDYTGATRLVGLMRQRKKKAVLLKILDLLRDQGLIA
jgi:putative (di)nucleoside polyphosphate hydrolase